MCKHLALLFTGFPTPKPPQCMDALGMESGQIPDSAISASSSANANTHAPSIGRLHFLSAGSGKYGSWAAGTNDINQFFQVDFGSWTKISAAATQGRQDSNQWVKSYSLSYSYDSVFWETVKDEQGHTQVKGCSRAISLIYTSSRELGLYENFLYFK